MKSYRLTEFGKSLKPEERQAPEPKGTEVLLEVISAGMCHTDLHLCEGGYDLGHGNRLSLTDRGVRLPLTLGHETVGRVLKLGPEASGVTVGQTCLIFPWIGCGECSICVSGNETFCGQPRFLGVLRDGGYADHIVVPHPRYLLDLEGIDAVSAAPYACAGVTTYSALKKAGTAILHEPIVIFGAGGLGLMSLGLLKAMDGVGAVVVDVDSRKREGALAAGAIAVVDGNATDVNAQLTRAVGSSPRVAIDFVGSEQSAAMGFNCLAKGGKLIMVGLFGGAAPWSLPLIAMRAITIQGNYVGTLHELAELLDLVRRKNVAPMPVVTSNLAGVNDMFQSLRQGKIQGRAVLTP